MNSNARTGRHEAHDNDPTDAANRPDRNRARTGIAIVLGAVGIVGASVALTIAPSGSPMDSAIAPIGIVEKSALDELIERRQALAQRGSGSAIGPRTLAEALPNFRYTVGNGAPKRPSEHVVVGHVVSVTEGEGLWRRPPADDPSDINRGEQVVVAFDDDRAQTRTLIVEVAVDSVVAGDSLSSARFEWAITASAAAPYMEAEDPAQVAEAFMQIDRGLFFLDRDGYVTRNDGRMALTANAGFGLVTEQGEISFPMRDPDSTESWMLGLVTVDDVQAESRKPSRQVSYTG